MKEEKQIHEEELNMENTTEDKTEKKIKAETKDFNIYKLLTVILAAVLVVVLIILIRNWYVRNRANQEYEDLAARVNQLQSTIEDGTEQTDDTEESVEGTEGTEEEEEEDELAGIDIPQKNLDWSELAEVNEDIYAWIYIPGTDVDYPILQHPTDNSHYLNYNMNGTRGYPGCLYTELVNSKDFTDFDTIIYGHNMSNGTMFSTLHYFEDQSFFNNALYVYIYTGDKVLVYEVFAAYTTSDEHIMYVNDFSTEAGRQAYLDQIMSADENAQMREVELTTDSHILTLSTCVKGKYSGKRYLVQAVLLNEKDLAE